SLLVVGTQNNPTPFLGGTLVPVPILATIPFVTSSAGTLGFPIPGGHGPATLFLQFAIDDPAQNGGAAISNALQVLFGP
ncbi:MAG: hypothetical protein H6834_18685, partial [Planctomycetes bacterium]|nr:hypothetical protein [Planctomycetota bacterium]